MASDEIMKQVNELAQEYDFDRAEFWCAWEGFDVYAPTFDDPNKVAYIGLPILFLVKDGIAREAMHHEVNEIYRAHYRAQHNY